MAYLVANEETRHQMQGHVYSRDKNVATGSRLVTTDCGEARAWLGFPEDTLFS